MKKIRKFKSSGMIWDDGEIPSCSFCHNDLDNPLVYSMHETIFSGGLVCNSNDCRLKYLDAMLLEEVEETTRYQLK